MVKKQKLIFDNSNLNESYSGVTTPLTFSFARRVYSGVYKEFSRVIGTPEKKINENLPMYDAMLGYICGRMYYNLINWYLLISFIPGYRFNRPFFEKMLGVSEEFNYDPRSKESGLGKLVELGLLFKQTIILLFQFVNLNKNVALFIKDFGKDYKKANSVNLTKLSNQDLAQFYFFYEQKFAAKWKITIVNDVAVMITTGVARNMAKSWLKDKNNELINRYLSTIKNLVSIKPGEDFQKILTQIKKNKSALFLFKEKNESQILYYLTSDKKFSDLKILILNYLKDYGDRAPNELKMESITFNDDREFFISLLKNQLPGTESQSKSREIKKMDLPEAIRKRLQNLSPFKRALFKLVIQWSRDCIKNREANRLKRSQVFGFARKTFKEFGQRLANEGYLKNKADVFYLQVEEIIGIFNGTLVDLNLKLLVQKRRKDFNAWLKIDVPERIEIEKSTYDYESRKLAKIKIVNYKKHIQKKELRGVTYSAGSNGGTVFGEALVLKSFDPSVSFVGKILVTKQTDPGWTPVFTQLKGIIVERGGMLSHAAIVAREFGIPCISQVESATDYIVTGQNVEMNIKEGIIKL